MHFRLRTPILVGKKKTEDLQFLVTVVQDDDVRLGHKPILKSATRNARQDTESCGAPYYDLFPKRRVELP